MLFAVGYGFMNRDKRLRGMLEEDRTIAVLLSAVHFEGTLKRSILALGVSPTVSLRERLSSTYRLPHANSGKNDSPTVRDVWNEEVATHRKNAALGKVIANFPKCIQEARATRGYIIHGNGTVSKRRAEEAVTDYLASARKLYDFCKRNKIDLDDRLKARKKRLRRVSA